MPICFQCFIMRRLNKVSRSREKVLHFDQHGVQLIHWQKCLSDHGGPQTKLRERECVCICLHVCVCMCVEVCIRSLSPSPNSSLSLIQTSTCRYYQFTEQFVHVCMYYFYMQYTISLFKVELMICSRIFGTSKYHSCYQISFRYAPFGVARIAVTHGPVKSNSDDQIHTIVLPVYQFVNIKFA